MTDSSILENFLGFGALILALFFLGSSIFVHELGHFLAARKRGLKVERFSIGFGPPIVSWKGKDGVEYRISWLPFGGYVALPQLADMGRLEGNEGEENEAHVEYMKSLPEGSYSDKMIALVMGSVFNLIFAFLLSIILWTTGQEVMSAMQQTRIGSVSPTLAAFDQPDTPSPASIAGLQPGDEVVAIDGAPIQDWQDLTYRIVTGLKRDEAGSPVCIMTVNRDGALIDIEVKPTLVTKEGRRFVGIGPMDIFEVSAVEPDSRAARAGFRDGDIFLQRNDERILSYFGMRQAILDAPDTPSTFTMLRGEEAVTINFSPAVVVDEASGMERLEWGFQPIYKLEKIYPNPVTQFMEKMEMFYLTLRALISPSSDVKVRNMSGPVGIIDNLQMATRIGIKQAIWFLVFININLAILNLLPIPVLDGGHMMFATIGKIMGKPLPQRFLESTQALFVVLLFSFMLYVTFFDFGRLKDRFLPEDNPAPATAPATETASPSESTPPE